MNTIDNRIPAYKAKLYFFMNLLICLLPIFGILISIVFLTLNIIRNDKKGIIYRGFFLIISMISTCIFFINLINGKGTKEGFAKLTQVQLNEVITQIEFYKLQNGFYPDSLQQLNSPKKYAVIIQDPLLVLSKPQSQTIFNYQRLENHYKLFSSGIDLIANTKDDIYPSIEITSRNTGFRK